MLTEIFQILGGAFDPTGFSPLWNCGSWSSTLGWLHILSDIIIFASYVAIPVMLGFFLRNCPTIPFHRIITLFACFIICCGTGHLLEAVIFWHPIYRFAGIWKLLTALISLATAITLIQIIPQALRIPEIIRINRDLQRAVFTINDLRKGQEEIAYGAAHSLKQPLRSLNFLISTVLSDHEDSLDKGVNMKLKHMSELGEKLHGMIEQMVTHANFMSVKLALESVNLGRMLKDSVVKVIPSTWNYELNTDIDEKDCVLSDPGLLSRSLETCARWIVQQQKIHDSLELQRVDLKYTRMEELPYEIRFTIRDSGLDHANLPQLNQLFPAAENHISLSIANSSTRRLGGQLKWDTCASPEEMQLVLLLRERPSDMEYSGSYDDRT